MLSVPISVISVFLFQRVYDAAMASLGLTSLIGLGLKAKLARRRRVLADAEHWRRNTAAIQIMQLRRLLTRAADTEFGRAHDFARIARLPDAEVHRAYAAAVPAGDFSRLAASLRRMHEEGEPNVLWPGRVGIFARTGGTSGGEKIVPISREMLRACFGSAMDVYATAANWGVSLPRLTGGKFMFISGPAPQATNRAGVRTGYISGIATSLIRWPISAIYSPGHAISNIDSWPERVEAMARAGVGQDVRMLCGQVSCALVVFQRLLHHARQLGRADAACVRDIWPNLELLVHTGMSYDPLDATMRELWTGSPTGPDLPRRLEVYTSSECFIASQDRAGEKGLRLAADMGNAFEFVPVEHVRAGEVPGDAPAFMCHQVRPGIRYAVVLNTCSGLWRYVNGDVVEFDDVPASPDGSSAGTGPCRLRVVGRVKSHINTFGEKIEVDDVERALLHAARAAATRIGEFTAGPVPPRDGRAAAIEVVVEMPAGDDERATRALARGVDEWLRGNCPQYGLMRAAADGLSEPVITAVPMGTFTRYLASRPVWHAQSKAPRCANTRDVIEGVKAVASAM